MKSTSNISAINNDGLKLNYISALKKNDYWRLFVDGYKQRKGNENLIKVCDFNENDIGHFMWASREPNGLNKLKLAALKLFDEHLLNDLTFDFIQKIHNLAYPFEDHLRLTTGYLLEGERTFGNITLQKDNDWVTNRAEYLKQAVGASSTPLEINKHPVYPEILEINTTWTLEEKRKYYPVILEKYNSEMSKTSDPSIKMELIAQHIQDIELLHFFSDGNARMIYLLLNKELIKNSLEPCILLDPNKFDQAPLNDLLDEIILGQKAYKQFIETGLPYDDCTSAEKIKLNLETIKDINIELFGDNNFPYEQSVKFTEEALEILDGMESAFQKCNSSKNYSENWTNLLKTILIYEYTLHFIPTLSLKEFSQSNLLSPWVQKCREDNGIEKPFMEYITNYLELLDLANVLEFITGNSSIEQNLEPTMFFNGAKQYLGELELLCNKYAGEYSVDTLGDPMTCHLMGVE